MRNVASASSEETLVKTQVLDVISATVGPPNDETTTNSPGVTEALITEAMDVVTNVMATSKKDMPVLIDSFGVALADVALSLDNNARSPRASSAKSEASSATDQFGALATGLCDIMVSNSLDGEEATGSATKSFSLSCQKDVVTSAGAISIKPLSLQRGGGGGSKSDAPAQPIQLKMDVQAEYSATFMQGPPGAFTVGASVRRRRLAEAARTQRAVTAAELRMKLSSSPLGNQKLRTSMRVELSPKQACGGKLKGCSIQNSHGDVHLRNSKRHGVLTHINFIDNGDGGLIQKFYTAELVASKAVTRPLTAKITKARAGNKPQGGTVVITVLERKAELLDKLIKINEVCQFIFCRLLECVCAALLIFRVKSLL